MRRALVPLLPFLIVGVVSGVAEGGRVQHCPRGRLADGRRLPERGQGFRIPRTWLERGLSYGTPALVQLITRVARRVAARRPGSTLYVADLSFPRGGRSAWHRTHREGRDADLIFFALDAAGRPAPPPTQMIPYDPEGFSPDGMRLFDVERNWALVRALVEDARVEKIFVAPWVEELLLGWARDHGAPDPLLARADLILSTPGAVEPHDDHFHVRIACGTSPVRRDTARSAPPGARPAR